MKYILFTTQTCPKCPEVKEFITTKVTFPWEMIDNTNPEFMVLAWKYGVTQAPTFIVFDDVDDEIFRANEVSEIQDYISINN